MDAAATFFALHSPGRPFFCVALSVGDVSNSRKYSRTRPFFVLTLSAGGAMMSPLCGSRRHTRGSSVLTSGQRGSSLNRTENASRFAVARCAFVETQGCVLSCTSGGSSCLAVLPLIARLRLRSLKPVFGAIGGQDHCNDHKLGEAPDHPGHSLSWARAIGF